MTLHQSTGLTVVVSHPLVSGLGYIETLTDQFSSWRHVTKSLGGYDSASFTIDGNQRVLEEWFDLGLGRDVTLYNLGLRTRWNGFVNKVSLRMGGFTLERGPLLNIANKVWLVYSTIDTSVVPPVLGIRVKTAAAEDSASQTRYGVLEKALSSGGVTDANALQVRDTYLTENKDPEVSQQFSSGSGNLTLSVECLGYIHMLGAYVYNSTTTGTQNLSVKLQNIITADPNSILSTDFNGITANTLQVGAWENDDDVALALIKGLTAKGDANDDRYLFGIYQDRKSLYEAAPTEVAYRQRLSSVNQQIETLAGIRVWPWDVDPGKWLFIADFLIGRTQPIAPSSMAEMRADPRYAFLEQVTFTAPYDINWVGSKTGTLPQKLARLGFAGLGA